MVDGLLILVDGTAFLVPYAANNKSGRVAGDDGAVSSGTAETLSVWKTAAVLLVRSCKGGYGM